MTAMLNETRCIHDQPTFHTERGELSTCSICRGLPYMVSSPLPEFEPVIADDTPVERVRWIPLEERTDCVLCEKTLDRGKVAAWVDRYEGTVGECCRDQVAA